MSTNMTLITSVTVGSGGAASVTLPATGTIPQTYTDLKLVYSARATVAGTQEFINISFNGNTSNYSLRSLQGDGSAASSNAWNFRWIGYAVGSTATASTFSNGELYIPNYTSSNYKSFSGDNVTENNTTNAQSILTANLWSDTAAITTIALSVQGGSNFVEGSTFYLYGISSVTSTTKATGGIVSSDGIYNYHMFPFSGTFTPTEAISADILVVAGGGGGGGYIYGGGGGAGGLVYSPSYSLSASSYAIAIGAGGTGTNGNGTNGGNTTFSSIYTATGGGGGGSWNANRNGQDGGSGGGGGENSGVGTAGTATQASYGGLGFGNNGGIWTGGNAGGGGGSGGVGGVGGVGYGNSAGGIGKQYLSFANATQTGANNGYYAAGGGGCSNGNLPIGQGGLGGGGNGSSYVGTGIQATNAIVNTGSGGGGSNTQASFTGGNGGSGLVIIRYAI